MTPEEEAVWLKAIEATNELVSQDWFIEAHMKVLTTPTKQWLIWK